MNFNVHLGIDINHSKDSKLTQFGIATVQDRYLLPGESVQQMYARVALAGADNLPHAQRMYNYLSDHWATPPTPGLTNSGTDRGLPISCYLNEVPDSRKGIFATFTENGELSANGGGIGTYWGKVRGIGARVKGGGQSSGVVPFMKIQDAITVGVSQGNLRRGSAAAYLPINHPEIEEFIDIRRATGGDPLRKCLNLFNGVTISDKFMHAVDNGTPFDLICPNTGEVTKTVSARDLFQRLVIARLETGTPYMVFEDTANESIPWYQKEEGLIPVTSNLCSEIWLPTNEERTAVCCLFQLNQLYFDEWSKDPLFIEDCVRYTDNILQDFIDNAPDELSRAKYSASQERSLGIGVMGFHSYLQSKNIPFASAMAKSINMRMGKHIKAGCDAATEKLAHEKGPCPDAAKHGVMRRNANVTAIAPTASVSIICGTVSPSMELWSANAFTQKTLSGSFQVRNVYLEALLEERGMNTPEVWSSIITNEGSVAHLEGLTDYEKEVYRTAFEEDQRWVLEHAKTRQEYVDQMISTNIFLRPDIHKLELAAIHIMAWRMKLKSLYYCRSKSLRRADKVSVAVVREKLDVVEEVPSFSSFDADGCLACQ